MPQQQYNAFISYAWVDNQPFEEGRLGWVSTFVDRLRKHLGRELRRQAVWTFENPPNETESHTACDT